MNHHPQNDALLEALRQFESPLLRYAYSICRDREITQDAVQETFLKLAKNADRLDFGKIGSWLFTVCRNCLRDMLRKKAKSYSLEDSKSEFSDSSPTPDIVAQQSEDHVRVLELVEQLPENQREVIRLRYIGDLSYVEIASITSNTIGTVGWLLHAALKDLRAQFPTPLQTP